MRRHTLLTITLMFVLTGVWGQPWVKHVDDIEKKGDPVTFFELQEAFEEYWSGKGVERGTYLKNGVRRKAPGWKQFKRWAHYWQYRIDPATGKFPNTTPYRELKAYKREHSQAMASDPSSWRNLGIASSEGGYAGIGRLNAIAFHPDDDQVMWVGAPSGGLWKSEDGGSSWRIQNEGTAVLGVSDIVVPDDYSSSQTLFIATGDRDGGSLWTLGGGQSNDNNSMGVLKSSDGGETWQTSLSFDVSQKKLVTRILMHPGDDRVLYAATSDGVYRTQDEGANWEYLSSASFIDMEFKPGDPTIMYGSTQSYSQTRIYRSTDGGKSWEMVQEVSGIRTELSVTPDAPARVYAIAANNQGGLKGIYRSTDSAKSFELVHSGQNLLGYYSDGSETGGQGSYDLTIQADPNHGDTLFVGGINTWRSTNGGETWTCVNMWTGSSTYNKSSVPVVHADKHAMAFQNGSSVFFEGNDGGIYKSTDYGNSWTDLTNGMVISQLYRIGPSRSDSSLVIAGLQDNGTKVMNDRQWDNVIGGDGMECIIDYSNPNIQYGTLYYGDIYRTKDRWNTRTSIRPLDSLKGHWATPYAINPENPASLYAGYNYLWKTTDRGDNWQKISDVQSDRKIRSLGVAPTDTQVIYMGDPGHLWKTTDGGQNWQEVTGSLPVNTGYITGLQVHADSSSHVWVTMGNYNQNGVFESTDGGNTWNNISGGLPDVPVMDVVQNRRNEDQRELYAATDIGVFRKIGREEWKIFSNRLPNVVVTELDIYYDKQTASNQLRAGTYGRGLWETSIPSLNYVPRPASFQTQINPESVDLSWQFNGAGDSVVVAFSRAPFEGSPSDSIRYEPGDEFAPGETVIYSGKDQNAYTHSGLTTLTDYHYRIWSFNGQLYSDSRSLKVTTTCHAPGEQATSLDYSSVGTDYITLKWTNGEGYGTLITASEAASIDQDPQSGRGYHASSTYGQGSQVGDGIYAVYDGQNDSVRVEGLQADRVYYFNLYEYNLTDSCYLKPALKGGTTTMAVGRETLSQAGFRVYPNPAGRHIRIESPASLKRFTCKLVNYTGQTVYQSQCGDVSAVTIPTEGFSSGVYILIIDTAHNRFEQKVVVE